MKETFLNLRSLGVKSIVVWYIWCLNDFLGIRENLTLNTSERLSSLQSLCEDALPNYRSDEKQKNTSNQMKLFLIHVLNPYLFFKTPPRFKFFINKLASNEALLKIIKQVRVDFQLPFDIAVKALIGIITEMTKENPNIPNLSWEEIATNMKGFNNRDVNIAILDDERENHAYIKEQLINISSREAMTYSMMHKNGFGEDTLWTKLNEFHRWIKS